MNLFPIVLFTYRRVPKRTIESLLKNDLASQSELFIYSDGYKNEIDEQDVLEVRQYLKSISGFKNITIFESNKNKGLANSIINGVTEIINKYERVIVLEDDLIVSNDFLDYMDDALEFYKDDNNIWSIGGYAPPLKSFDHYRHDVYVTVRATSWGWATWKNRWDTVDWEAKEFIVLQNNRYARKKFELGGDDMYKMLDLQMSGKIDSWAIRWCFSQFLQNKYTIYPNISKIYNSGFDDVLATHNIGSGERWNVELNHNHVKFEYIEPDNIISKAFKEHYDLKWKTKVGYFLKKYGGYKKIKNLQSKAKSLFIKNNLKSKEIKK